MDESIKEKETWDALRPRLSKGYGYNDDWEEAIKLFDTRIKKKFFTPVRTIIKNQELQGEGFAIVTVLCALIESLASFRKGKIYSFYLGGLPSYYYSRSGEMVEKFLHTDDIFKNNFWIEGNDGKRKYDYPAKAKEFYSDVRCGLLHEARTKGNWYINATKKDVKKETVFIEKRGEKMVILRTVMFFRLKVCVTNYCQDLRNEKESFNELRKYFARKLDNIYGYDHTAKYDWWGDR